MSNLIKDYEFGFTQVPNYIIGDDNRLTWKAKGIYLYLASKPDNWDYFLNDIISRARDGRVSVQSALKELEKYGYLKRVAQKGVNGKFSGWDWLLRAKPDDYELRQT